MTGIIKLSINTMINRIMCHTEHNGQYSTLVLFLKYFYTLISGKILQKIWNVQFLHKMENLCMERVKPGRFYW